MKRITTRLMAIAVIALCMPLANADSRDASVYLNAVANEARSEADVARDPGRRPAEVLSFLRIEAGMSVLDLFSGGGYYSEILSYVVGNDGHVLAHSNKAYLQFVGEEFVARYAGGRLANVDLLMAENNKLRLDPNSLDAILMGLSYHDTYWVNPDNGWPEIDRDKLLATLFAALKPGGVLGLTDHYAAEGTGSESVPTLHRIEKSLVIADLEAAGFELDAESDILRNPADDHSKSVFDESTRGQTDRFVLRFRKPK